MSIVGQKLPVFYRELLNCFSDLRNKFEDTYGKEFILWNNKDVILRESLFFWKNWFDRNIYHIQDLLDANGNFLTLSALNDKYKVSTNFLRYQQIISAIPRWLRNKASESPVT